MALKVQDKAFLNPALRFGTRGVQAVRDITAGKIPLRPVAVGWNRLRGCPEMADKQWDQRSGVQGAKNTECKRRLWAATAQASSKPPPSASKLFTWSN